MIETKFYPFEETVYTKTLQNGLSVILVPKRNITKTYALFSTEYGSIDRTFIPIGHKEPITVPDGIAHFLEHKLFEKEDRDVFMDFSKLGASPNAYTSFTNTAYLFSATDHIPENVELLVDFVQDPYFSDESVEKEKGIIAQEIKMYDDEPDWRLFMGTIQTMFKDHPVNIDIAGTVDSIQKITKEDLYTCYHTFYHPANMTLAVVGNFDPLHLLELIEINQQKKQFPMPEKIERFVPEEREEVAQKEHSISMPVSVPRCLIGIKEVPHSVTNEELIQKHLIQNMILDYYFSKAGEFYERLYKEQLIESDFSYRATTEKSFGYTMIGGKTQQPEKFREIMMMLLNKMKEQPISEEAFEQMRRKRIGRFLRELNSPENIANQMIHYKAFGINYFEMMEKIQNLTLQEINDFIPTWLEEDKISIFNIQRK